VNRLVGVVEPDVHVHAEDQLLARDEAQRRDEVAVARPRDDPLVLPHREGMCAGGADRQPAGSRRLAHVLAQRAQLVSGLGDVGARLGRDLHHGLHELGLDLAVLALDVGGAGVLEQGLDRVDERVALGVDDHQLLLHAHREARPGEVRAHRGAAYPDASP